MARGVIIRKSDKGVVIGKGNLHGKGVFASRSFRTGEVVIKYNRLPEQEQDFVHSYYGKLYLYSIPERYVNHSSNPNTLPDHDLHADIAVKNIKKGDKITTDHTKDDVA